MPCFGTIVKYNKQRGIPLSGGEIKAEMFEARNGVGLMTLLSGYERIF